MMHLRLGLTLGIALAGATCFGQSSPNTAVGQSIADAIRSAAGTAGALVPSALISPGNKSDLSSCLRDATEEIIVLNLTGAQLKQAFERSLASYPQDSNAYLYVSGFEIVFNRNAASGSRVVTVSADGSKLADGQTYSIAMPSSLGRGGLGYFKIWDKSKIARTLPGVQLGSLLKDKRATDSPSRYSGG
jgi:2',3'-cyclic-nucleotide 2'-phosphodiesterase (5'-nucleotidase family)